MTATDDMVVVATYDVPAVATVARNALAAEGIPAAVIDDHVASLLPSDAVGGVKVVVPAAFAAGAALRIAAHDAAGGTAVVDIEELSRQALQYQPTEV